MEQQKLSAISVLKYSISTFWTHIALYAEIAACTLLITTFFLFGQRYIETYEFIYSDFWYTIVTSFHSIFKLWFWGACVVVATQLINTGRASFSDFVGSLKYTPQFALIQILFSLPTAVADELTFSPLAPIGLVISIFGVIARYYGQIAIPLFVAQKDAWLSIRSSFSQTHQLGKPLRKTIFCYVMIIFALCLITFAKKSKGALVFFLEALLLGMAYFHFGDRVLSTTTYSCCEATTPHYSYIPTFIAICVIYPILALAYSYLLAQSRKDTKHV